jgi:N-acetylmuramoyl-L-alanine amidase
LDHWHPAYEDTARNEVRARLSNIGHHRLGTCLPTGFLGGSTEAASTKDSAQAKCDRGRFRILVDVGHTAEISGAISARGVPEYEFNLKLARAIERELSAAGFRSTLVLITGGATFAGLVSRVKRANEWPADLFLSIHHDSVPARFLDVWDHEGVQRKYSDRFRGHSMFVSHENPQAAASLYFAQLLGDELKARGLRYTPHYAEAFMQERRRELLDPTAGVYRYDQLIVLKSTRMPAVLFEAGSIVNRDEELVISTPAHRSIIAAAATQAVEIFCAARREAGYADGRNVTID